MSHENLNLPSDWPPLKGDINLAQHDLPHSSSKTEWWYINTHLKTESGRDVSGFAAFFRMAVESLKPSKTQSNGHSTEQYRYSHSITWALVDPANKKYHSDSQLDHQTPKELQKLLKENKWNVDRRLNAALIEVLNKGQVPLPDRLFDAECTIDGSYDEATKQSTLLKLNYGLHTFESTTQGTYQLHCTNPSNNQSMSLTLTAMKPVQRQAHDGVVKVGISDEWMFYYFIPRMSVTGTVTIDGVTENVTGEAWYDHEFGGDLSTAEQSETQSDDQDQSLVSVANMQEAKARPDHAWNWLSAQFDDGSELTATHLVNTTVNTVVDNYGLMIHADGTQSIDSSMEWNPLKQWVSLRTTNDYPTCWSLKLPLLKLDITVQSAFDDQEFVTLISKPAFFEGRVHITGTKDGKPISGVGFVERFGFNQISALDHFFKRMSKLVMKSLDAYFPHNPTEAQFADLMCRVDGPRNPDKPYSSYGHLLHGLSAEVFKTTIVDPIRAISDRGGKSWRSYALLLAIDLVGGNSERFRSVLPMPEIMHVGSLIIDDIQDESSVRRGGPSCHITYGVPIAINAGTYAYFLSPRCLTDPQIQPPLTALEKARCYDTYFVAMRLGHVGQAADIFGSDYLMSQIVENGDVDGALEHQVAATHRLKSAVPAGCLARIGAFLGGGSEDQIEYVGLFFEAIGLSFQIVDDILNLKGFVGDTKQRGEDITAGKVTYPVACAMKPENSTKEQRAKMWSIIKSRPTDSQSINQVIEIIEACNGIKLSQTRADDHVRKAWAQLDAHIPDSFYKLMVRAFGFYVLERHY